MHALRGSLVGWLLLAGCAQSKLSSESDPIIGNTKGIIESLAPNGHWGLGELSGNIMVDKSNLSINGAYHGSYSLGQPPAIRAQSPDLDTAVHFSGGSSSYAEVPTHKAYSLTQAWDSFSTLVFPGWGTAPDGQTWVPQISTSLFDYGVDSSGAYVVGGVQGTFQQPDWQHPTAVRGNADTRYVECSPRLWDDFPDRAGRTAVAVGGKYGPCRVVGGTRPDVDDIDHSGRERREHILRLRTGTRCCRRPLLQ